MFTGVLMATVAFDMCQKLRLKYFENLISVLGLLVYGGFSSTDDFFLVLYYVNLQSFLFVMLFVLQFLRFE